MRMLLAARDLPVEPAIVQAAGDVGLQVVRRCLDTSDLLAAASVEDDLAVAVSMGFPRIGPEVIGTLGSRRIIALAADDHDAGRARAWGIPEVIRADLPGPEIAQRIRNALSGGVWSLTTSPAPGGTVITVTSAAGAPGRTQVAIALARSGRTPTCLIDADTRGPAVAQRLGVHDDISGLALAVRHLHNGTLSTNTIRAASARFADNLYLLTGCTEAAGLNLDEIITTAAQAFDRVVIDTPPLAEKHESAPPIRDQSANPAVVFVMTPDDVSVTRTIRLLMHQPTPGAVLAVNGVRGRRRLRQVQTLLHDQGIELPVVPAGDIRSINRSLKANGPNMREHIRSTRREGYRVAGNTTTRSPIFDQR
jgi:Mrp family chromosome partitioning ATPase